MAVKQDWETVIASIVESEDVVSLAVDGVDVSLMRPAEPLGAFITDYALYDAGPAGVRIRTDLFVPGPATVRITFDDGLNRVALGRRKYEWHDAAMLFGPSSYAMQVGNEGGRMVGFGITPKGWARLLRVSAGPLADRVVPLADLLGAEAVAALRAQLRGAATGEDVKAVLDAFLVPRLAKPHRDERAIDAVSALLLDDEVGDIATLAARIGSDERALRRLTRRHFGFTPKLLLNRVRFLKAYLTVVRTGDHKALDELAPRYFDHSHFSRDANRFLGTTARRFALGATPFMQAIAHGRARLLGQPFRSLARAAENN